MVLILQLAALILMAAGNTMARPVSPGPHQLAIGYTELQTDLAGGRHANVATMRACTVRADGSGRKELAPDIVGDSDTWTQFAGWSPDGKTAVVGRGWESKENAAWEEVNKNFRYNAEGWLYDTYLVNLSSSRRATNITAVDRVSYFNSGLFFWPGDANRLGFTALIDGNSHPYSMDISGHNKQDLTKASNEFTYGFSSAPDGKRIAYHKSYQIYLADADGSNALHIDTHNPFNFGPTWSPDGKWVLFLSGEHYKCHPTIVRADGTGLRKIADRGIYSGAVDFLDVPDFHQGSSDVPIWSPDGQWIYYAAQKGNSVELFRAATSGEAAPEQLTTSATEGTTHYHPEATRDGKWLAYGCKRDGVRQLCVMRISDHKETQITHFRRGRGAMWPHWRP